MKLSSNAKLALGAGVGIVGVLGLAYYFGGSTAAASQAITPYNPQGNAPTGGGGGTSTGGFTPSSGTAQGTPVGGSTNAAAGNITGGSATGLPGNTISGGFNGVPRR